ncbi:MAG: hypothetical protein GXO50_04075 [Chlorobi bacterium]|nr:hypothetical protein [Chlorobiota bacterium]
MKTTIFNFAFFILFLLVFSFCSEEKNGQKTEKAKSKKTQDTLVSKVGRKTVEKNEKRNVIDYFRLLQESKMIDVDCKLIKRKKTWLCESEKNEAGFSSRKEAVVDIKNGYIQIVDEGTGGGALITEIALFKTTDKKDIIGVNTYFADGMLQMSSFPPTFYSYKDTSLVSLKNIFPKTDPNMFFIKPYDLEKELIGSYYILPHYGTNIKFCLDSSFVSLREESFKKNIKTYEFTYLFDKEKGKFLLKK